MAFEKQIDITITFERASTVWISWQMACAHKCQHTECLENCKEKWMSLRKQRELVPSLASKQLPSLCIFLQSCPMINTCVCNGTISPIVVYFCPGPIGPYMWIGCHLGRSQAHPSPAHPIPLLCPWEEKELPPLSLCMNGITETHSGSALYRQ